MDQELNTDPTATNNSDDEEYYREDDAFGSLTAVGPDEDVEEYEATQALLRPHAAAAAATEIGPSSPTGDDDRSVASSTGDISITVEGAVRKRRPSVHAPSLQGAAMNDNEDEDVVVIDDDDEDDEDNYAQAADSMAEPTQLHDSSISMDADDVSRTVSTRNKSSRGDSGCDDDDGDDDTKKPDADTRAADMSNGNQTGHDMLEHNANDDENDTTDLESGPVYSLVETSLFSIYACASENTTMELPDIDWDSQQRIYDSIKAVAPTIGKDQWQCRACTFINDNPESLVCSICDFKRIERNEPTGPPMSGMLEDDLGIEIRPKLAKDEKYDEDGEEGWVIFEDNRHLCYGWGIGIPNVCYIRYVGRENEESIEMEWRKKQRRGRRREARAKQAVGVGRDESREKTVSELQAEEYFSPKKRRKKRDSNISSPATPKSTTGRKRQIRSRGSPGSDELGAGNSSTTSCHASPERGGSPGLKSPDDNGNKMQIELRSDGEGARYSSDGESSNERSHVNGNGSVCDRSTSWSCNTCHFLHENKSADFLACEMCRSPRKETNIADFRAALANEAVVNQASPRISFDCSVQPPLQPSAFPLAGVETIEALMYPNGNVNREPEWTIVSADHHLCHEKSSNPDEISGTCTMSWIRQGDPRPFTTRWRVCKGRASRGTAPLLLSTEQVANVARRRPASRKKRVLNDASSSKEDGFASDSASTSSSTKRQKKGYLEDRLGMSMEDIEKAMPKALAERVHDCVWVPWKGKDGGKVYHPALILRPADISGKTDALELVGTMIEKSIQTKSPEVWNRHLVFWYSYGYSWAKKGAARGCKAFTLEEPEILVPYSVGVERGYNRPEDLMSKINSPNLISWREGCFLDGLKQIEKDAKVEKRLRGGPFFFEHQRQMLREEAKRLEGERELRIDMGREEKAAKREKRRMEDREAGKDKVNDRNCSAGLCSLELCSGEAKMTEGFREAGFWHTITLDNDRKKESVSNLSLQQLEYMMERRNGDKRWLEHPTNERFHTIWAGPCCTTYSIAQSTKIYRTEGERYFCQPQLFDRVHFIYST